jgi:glycosyltransferase involved in cell wall biosynthesis
VLKLAVIVEAIPPYCGGGEQVAWVHAVELAKSHDVSVITFGKSEAQETRDGVNVYYLPYRRRNLVAYCTGDRVMLNKCIDRIAPTVVHCHMPHILSACLRKKDRLMVSTIHDGVPENELLKLGTYSKARWLKFKLIRRINIHKADLVTCVSRHCLEVMRSIYPRHADKFSFIPNPIAARYLSPVKDQEGSYVLNFGRQIPLKVASLLEAAMVMPETPFVFVGTGEMVKDYGMRNVSFAGFSDSVEEYIDAARVCVFPSLSENFPLVGLEAMARGKPVIATKRGFSEYIQHMKNGYLLESTEPEAIKAAVNLFMSDSDLCRAIGTEARKTAEEYRPASIVELYVQLYQNALLDNDAGHRARIG